MNLSDFDEVLLRQHEADTFGFQWNSFILKGTVLKFGSEIHGGQRMNWNIWNHIIENGENTCPTQDSPADSVVANMLK